uniref:bZIP transcription factor 1 n=1 Tax=Phytophthora infestans TaxID=4787 RepID=BZP1_PHYIN|nr:RecName: Full=bZIP transcription factor 1; AltName: Full=bZIP protein 1; Short=Pibzp1 [Phytophthora infestans]AAX19188.1 bZIP family transcription factor [Phytophthora infestans]
MNLSRFAPSPSSDSLISTLRPRAAVRRLHSNITGPMTPFKTAVNAYVASEGTDNSYVVRPRLYNDKRAQSDGSNALLSSIGPSGTTKRPRDEMDCFTDTHKHKRGDGNKSRRREQCRANQARYRDKQRNAQQQLERSVEQLQSELSTLKHRNLDLASRQRTNQSPWNTVAEVFRLLGVCFRSPWRVTCVQEMRNHSEMRQILAILERSFTHDVAMGDLRGIDALMEQLLQFSQY